MARSLLELVRKICQTNRLGHRGVPLLLLTIGLVMVSASVAGPAAAVEAGTSQWWSLRPLSRPPLPDVGSMKRSASGINPIDCFILAKLAEKGLSLSPTANRRTLIRRVYFDLIGLPPTPEEIAAFVRDPEAQAYEKLVDGLLASPRYGERWARHWLDVVHYGETHGYDKDQPRPNAWPYRDYVIRAFNQDRPYHRFLEEQIAGDVLFPNTRDGIEGLGFIAAGPWDLIGHAEVPETKIDGKVARHLDRDDMVANTMQTFNSLTVQCAQCHDHKFDPIRQEDYYGLQAVFAALDRTNKKYDPDPEVARQRAALLEQERSLVARNQELETRAKERAGTKLATLDKQIAALEKKVKGGDAFGYHSQIEKSQEITKWVQVDLTQAISLSNLVLYPCQDDFNNIGEGFGFPVRFKVELSDDAEFKQGVSLIGDQTQEDVPNPKLRAQAFAANGRKARYVRVTATKLALRQSDYIFALAELVALTPDGRNAALKATVTALDSIQAPVRWQKANLTDGWYPGISGTTPEPAEVAQLREQQRALLEASVLPAEKAERTTLETELAEAKRALEQLPPQRTVFVGAIHHGTGSFLGTGSKGGKPRPIYVLQRGNVQKPGAEVAPGALPAVSGLPARFELPRDHAEGARRAALAKWLSATQNPLTWRSIVNRVWQYHFGRGLVDTSNDFGRMGSLPTHPELLDWLAAEFRDGGESFKALHRLIVTSATYRQASSLAAEASAQTAATKLSASVSSGLAAEVATGAAVLDPDNRFLWRQNRRKLEAEAVRDSLLFVAGKLDLRMGGPSFQDFVIERPEHSPHYEYHLHNPEDVKSHRRSIYRFIVRSQPQPFMTTLDCADPSIQVGRRNESVSPLQALALLNNALLLTMSQHFAAKLERLPGDLASKVRKAYEETLGCPPSPPDEQALVGYAGQFGLANLCRVLFNLNEFTFVD